MTKAISDLLNSAGWLPLNCCFDAAADKSDILLATASGGQFTTGFSFGHRTQRANDDDLADRLYWWPRGVPPRPWIAIVSSRLGRRLEQRGEWFHAFRAACDVIDQQQGVLLSGSKTATGSFAERAGQLFNLKTLLVHEPRSTDVLRWLRGIGERDRRMGTLPVRTTTVSGARQEFPANDAYEVFVSPPLDPHVPRESGSLSMPPLRDRIVSACADQLFVIFLRRRGVLEQLLRHRLAELRNTSTEIFVACGPGFVPPELADELCGMGAASWPVPAGTARVLSRVADNTIETTTSSSKQPIKSVSTSSVLSLSAFLASRATNDWEFLTHCTRAPPGPWPEQSKQDYIDELLTQCCLAERSPCAALSRILAGDRIMATSAAIRGGTRTVCFTAVPLEELHRLRVFQPQRQRWDFEPYGICISRAWLQACGTRPVIYGDDDDWKLIGADDRPFFQLKETRRGTRRRSWTKEKEWRHVGDVDLSGIPANEAVVFVPTDAEATSLSRISRWPVVVLSRGRGHP